MPISTAPYKRTYQHTKARGREYTINCGVCGRLVPKYKTFVMSRGISINDPFISSSLQEKKFLDIFVFRKVRLCPSCARFHGIKQPGKAVRKKHLEI